ncbi:DUF1391 family protein, partial [Escherichia coli]|nr:DUF1391 domain-containing protein [Escherichia coli]
SFKTEAGARRWLAKNTS